MKKLVLFVLVLAIFVCIENVACSSEYYDSYSKYTRGENANESTERHGSSSSEKTSHIPSSIEEHGSSSSEQTSHIRPLVEKLHKKVHSQLAAHQQSIRRQLDKLPASSFEEFSKDTESFVNHRVVKSLLLKILPEDRVIFAAFFVGYMIFTTDILVSFRVELFISFIVYMLLLAYNSQILSTGLLNYDIVYPSDVYMQVICYLLEYFLIACLAYTVSCISEFYRYIIYLVYFVTRFIAPRTLPYTKLLHGIPLILIAWFLIIVFSIFQGADVLKPFLYHLVSSISGLFFALLVAIIVAQREAISQYVHKTKLD